MNEFENNAEVVVPDQNLKGTSDMPDPEVLVYENMYEVTSVFKNDLKKILDEIPYVEAKKFYDVLAMNNDRLPAALMNEFIRNLGMLPYKYVSPLMRAIERKDAFEAYFILHAPTQR